MQRIMSVHCPNNMESVTEPVIVLVETPARSDEPESENSENRFTPDNKSLNEDEKNETSTDNDKKHKTELTDTDASTDKLEKNSSTTKFTTVNNKNEDIKPDLNTKNPKILKVRRQMR